MTIYTKTTDFQAKDALASGNPLKIVKGTEIDDEFDAIAAADATNLKKDGTVAATGNIPMGTYKLTGLGSGSAATDSANLGQVQAGAYQLIGSISGVDTITGSLSPAISAYAAGQKFSFVSAGANTGAVTININALGAKSITKYGTTALAAGDIPNGALVEIEYDGTRFQICNLTANTVTNLAGGSAGTIPYQSAAGTTAMLAAGTAGYALIANGAAAPVWTDKTASDTVAGFVEFATDAEVVTGTDTTRSPSVSSMRNSLVVANASEATTSGTTKDKTGIPSWAKRIMIHIIGVSTNGAGNLGIQGIVGGSAVTTGYLGSVGLIQNGVSGVTGQFSSSFQFGVSSGATTTTHGTVYLERVGTSNTWMCSFSLGCSHSSITIQGGGSKAFAGTVEGVRLDGGGSTFDAGEWAVSWE